MTEPSPPQVVVDRADLGTLVARARRLAEPGRRVLLGIAGSPGSGKSTLAEQLVGALAGAAVLVPMDGFHYARSVLRRLGREERKGAIDTFDAGGFVHLLRRVRAADEPVVYAPTFRRDLEEPIAGAVAVRREVPLVVVEGNYLLADQGEWAPIRGLLDEAWFLDLDDGVRLERLVARHVRFGRDLEAARAHAHGSDQANADLVESTRSRADVLVVERP